MFPHISKCSQFTCIFPSEQTCWCESKSLLCSLVDVKTHSEQRQTKEHGSGVLWGCDTTTHTRFLNKNNMFTLGRIVQPPKRKLEENLVAKLSKTKPIPTNWVIFMRKTSFLRVFQQKNKLNSREDFKNWKYERLTEGLRGKGSHGALQAVWPDSLNH